MEKLECCTPYFDLIFYETLLIVCNDTKNYEYAKFLESLKRTMMPFELECSSSTNFEFSTA